MVFSFFCYYFLLFLVIAFRFTTYRAISAKAIIIDFINFIGY